jgi:hypothetical protein
MNKIIITHTITMKREEQWRKKESKDRKNDEREE